MMWSVFLGKISGKTAYRVGCWAHTSFYCFYYCGTAAMHISRCLGRALENVTKVHLRQTRRIDDQRVVVAAGMTGLVIFAHGRYCVSRCVNLSSCCRLTRKTVSCMRWRHGLSRSLRWTSYISLSTVRTGMNSVDLLTASKLSQLDAPTPTLDHTRHPQPLGMRTELENDARFRLILEPIQWHTRELAWRFNV